MRENEGCLVKNFCFFRLKRLKSSEITLFCNEKRLEFFFLGLGGGGGGKLIWGKPREFILFHV